MTLRSEVRLRLLLGEDIALGPGKADLLDAIRYSGSISAAAKMLGMSYRRAWMLVETMNACFTAPLVTSVKGGRGGGGAEVTPEGRELLDAFRGMQADVDRVVQAHLRPFEQRVRGQRGRAKK